MHDIRPFLTAPFERPGTVLYVGYRKDACAWLQELWEAGNSITVLEVWPQNVTDALGDGRVAHFVVGDVREMDGALAERYDHVFWWHGPEHVPKDQFPGTLLKLARKARTTLAVASPWGVYEQGEHGGNPHERHLWSVYEDDFLLQGLTIVCDGAKDQPGSEIVGWVTFD